MAMARARRRAPKLFNAARHRPASQSSTAGSKGRHGPHRATDGRLRKRGFSATNWDESPWWMVELPREWPIYSIRIHGPRKTTSATMAGLQVSVSCDGKDWETIYCSHHHFGDAESPGPLVIDLRDKKGGRFVRLELPCRGRLELSQVEVMVAKRHKALLLAARRYGFDFNGMTFLAPGSRRHYSVQNVPRNFDGRLEAFHVNTRQGRFGNNLHQIGRAVCLAQRLGVPRVYLKDMPMLTLDRPVKFGNVAVMPQSALRRDKPKAVLCGPFYYPRHFGPAGAELSAQEVAAAERAIGQPAFYRSAVTHAVAPGSKDLVIHFRAGDVFGAVPHKGYTQPPLAFYQLCLNFARAQLGIERVILVYEDEGNPCVAALTAWLGQIGVPYIAQSRSLAEDMAVLLAASHVVFGRGTFGPAIALLSSNLRTLFHSWLQGSFSVLPEVRVIGVEDTAGGYIKIGDWRNTPEQRQMMLEYAIENLQLKDTELLPNRGAVRQEPLVI